MPEYLSPGVYVEEIDTGPKPIQGVSTSTAVFVGITEKAQMVERVDGELTTRDLLNTPSLVTNWTQYSERFGGFVDGAYLPQSIYGFFQNGGARCYVLSIKTMPKAQVALLNTQGKPQLIVNSKQAGYEGLRLRVGVEPTEVPKPTKAAAKSKDGESETPAAEAAGDITSFTVTVERETPSGRWRTEETLKDVTLVETSKESAVKAKVAFKDNKKSKLIDIMVPENVTLDKLWPRQQQQSLQIEPGLLQAASPEDFRGDASQRSGIDGLEAIDDISIVCVPDLMAPTQDNGLDLDMIKNVQGMIIAHCEHMGDRVAILDAPPDMTPQDIYDWRMDTAGFDSSYAALYYPWIEVQDPVTRRPALVPPSGYIAGVWARSDTTRGVHKAPANEVIQGCTGMAYNVTKGEQDILNPVGVNCIRTLPGMGIRIWGARTLSSNASWRYINVRRLFNYVEKAIERGTMWVVFEPNNHRLWGQVNRDVTAFLSNVWRSGALFGSTPEQAFFVKCDEELNPPAVRDQGQLIIEIGLAPVKPAEFVIFRISQWAGGAGESEEEGGEDAAE
jgi:uncharacterized protein